MTVKRLTKSIARTVISVCCEQLSAVLRVQGDHDGTASNHWTCLKGGLVQAQLQTEQ